MKKLFACLSVLALLCAGVPALAEEQPDRLCALASSCGFKLGAPLSFDQVEVLFVPQLVKGQGRAQFEAAGRRQGAQPVL